MTMTHPGRTLPRALVAELTEEGPDPREVLEQVTRALAEDCPGEDVTSVATVPADAVATADLVARADGTVAGLAVAELVLLTATGPTRLLPTAERTALNHLCHLSGVATTTARWVGAVRGTGARVRDTRTTTPGLRLLEKYAVRCGGATNHRTSLSEASGGLSLERAREVAATGVDYLAVGPLTHSSPVLDIAMDLRP